MRENSATRRRVSDSPRAQHECVALLRCMGGRIRENLRHGIIMITSMICNGLVCCKEKRRLSRQLYGDSRRQAGLVLTLCLASTPTAAVGIARAADQPNAAQVAQADPATQNALAKYSLEQLAATRDRPLFSPNRRP